MYLVGETTGNQRLIFEDGRNGTRPINLQLTEFFGKHRYGFSRRIRNISRNHFGGLFDRVIHVFDSRHIKLQ
jgi:hypothetical protein